jgi:hypothetical protein
MRLRFLLSLAGATVGRRLRFGGRDPGGSERWRSSASAVTSLWVGAVSMKFCTACRMARHRSCAVRLDARCRMSLVPSRPNSSLLYHRQRVAGDFYEFLRVGPSRVLFGLFDLAAAGRTRAPFSLRPRAPFEVSPPIFSQGRISTRQRPWLDSAMRSTAPSWRLPAGFAAAGHSSVATTRTWGRSATRQRSLPGAEPAHRNAADR